MSKLEEMLKYISENNEFYKNRIKQYGIKNPLDITQWPILTRKELQESRYNMFSDGYKAKYFNQQLKRQSSSGSSGIPVNIYWDHKDYFRSTMSLWRLRKKYYGISPASRKVSFSLMNIAKEQNKIIFSNTTENIINFNYSSIYDENHMLKVIEIINVFKPEWLYAQPSILLRLLQCYKKYNIYPVKSLVYIESMGELLPPYLKKQLEVFFEVPVVDMYGSEEHNGIAYECPYGKKHVIDDNVKVEVFRNGIIYPSGEGTAIITNLNNKAMPLIRYNQGDNIKLVNNSDICLCESQSSYIEVINGRQSEMINDHNVVISTFFLNEIIAETQNQYNDPITQYVFKYLKKQNRMELCIAIDPNMIKWAPQIINNLKKKFYEKLNNMSAITFEVNICSDIDYFKPINNKYKILHIEE